MLADPWGEQKQERCYWRRVGFAVFIFLLVLIFAVLLLLPRNARAEARYKASQGDIAVTLYDEPCTHPEFVSNLPYRATWAERGKVFDGCFAYDPQQHHFKFWFTDKSVLAIPEHFFAVVVES